MAFPTRASSSSRSSRTAWRWPASMGASDASVEVSEGAGLSVSVRKGELENVERNRDKSVGVSIYLGQRRGNASSSDFSRGRAAADGARGLRHRALHRRRPGGRPARRRGPGHAGRGGARPGAVLSLGHRCAARGRTGQALRGRGDGHRPAHHQFRRRRRVGAAVALLGRQHARLSRRLCQLAALPVGVADRRQGRGHAARRLVQLDARRARAGRARGGGPLRRRTRAVAAEVAQGRHLRGAGAVRGAGGHRAARRLRAGHQRRLAVPQGQLPARQPGPARAARARGHRRGPAHPARQGQRALRRRGRAHAGAQGGRARRGAELLPVELFGAQARPAHHRPCRRLAEPGADAAASRSPATTSTRCCASWAAACSSPS